MISSHQERVSLLGIHYQVFMISFFARDQKKSLLVFVVAIRDIEPLVVFLVSCFSVSASDTSVHLFKDQNYCA